MEPHHPKRETLLYQKQNLSLILEETKPLEIDICKSEKRASVSEVLALINCSSYSFSVGYFTRCIDYLLPLDRGCCVPDSMSVDAA